MGTADSQDVHETPSNTDSADRAGDQPRPDQGAFPIGLIPFVPLLGVLIAIDTFFILHMVL
jgi:hypothetical protein